MKYPGRGIFCNHLSCFSIVGFFRRTQGSFTSLHQTYACPLCGVFVPYTIYDKYIAGICSQVSNDHMDYVEIACNEKAELEIHKFRYKTQPAAPKTKHEATSELKAIDLAKRRKQIAVFYKSLKRC